jgi:hypothetical protein
MSIRQQWLVLAFVEILDQKLDGSRLVFGKFDGDPLGFL